MASQAVTSACSAGVAARASSTGHIACAPQHFVA
jgi:hypothetical protein